MALFFTELRIRALFLSNIEFFVLSNIEFWKKSRISLFLFYRIANNGLNYNDYRIQLPPYDPLLEGLVSKIKHEGAVDPLSNTNNGVIFYRITNKGFIFI